MENVAGLIIMVLAVGFLVGVAVYMRTGSRTHQDSLFVSISPQESIERISAEMVQGGYAVAHRGEMTATFTRPKKPKTDTGCLLLLLGIIPGLLYFGLFKGTYTTSVVAVRESSGTRLVISGDDYHARQRLSRWVQSPP